MLLAGTLRFCQRKRDDGFAAVALMFQILNEFLLETVGVVEH